MQCAYIIIGGGLYGLYSALFCAKRGDSVVVLECDDTWFKRSTYVNQARVHMGYHYPRSISTALKSRGYFDRFNRDFGFCINREFKKIYALSTNFSWTTSEQFKKFCTDSQIDFDEINPATYFNDDMCEGAYLTQEYTYDAGLLRDYFLSEASKYDNLTLMLDVKISTIKSTDGQFQVVSNRGDFQAPFVLNATYASVNQVIDMVGLEKFKIKYELCEIILCEPNAELMDKGITVMDGPFFSLMPFGNSGLHSLTSVTFTPHATSYDEMPTFPCQPRSGGYCSPNRLGNCNDCPAKPTSAWPYMEKLARKYIKPKFGFNYHSSLFSIKPILRASEIDDSRPTVIRKMGDLPVFVSVLSGKINTVYDLDEVLTHG